MDQKFGELNEIQKEYLNDALQSSKYLLALINDILDLKKVETGEPELEISDINVNTLLETSLTMIREKALSHGLQMSMKIDDVPKKFRGDQRKLQQVIYNLLIQCSQIYSLWRSSMRQRPLGRRKLPIRAAAMVTRKDYGLSKIQSKQTHLPQWRVKVMLSLSLPIAASG